MNRLYIAYGSNLNLRQMAHRCPSARVVGQSILQDYELLFRGSLRAAVATVEPKPGGRVPVLIWSIRPRDEKSLDIYEGWPRFYRKEDITVKLNGKPVSAMIYLPVPIMIRCWKATSPRVSTGGFWTTRCRNPPSGLRRRPSRKWTSGI